MKILHLSAFESKGGAALGAYQLHEQLLFQNIDSIMLVGKRQSSKASVVCANKWISAVWFKIAYVLETLYLQNIEKVKPINFSTGLFEMPGLQHKINKIDPDIIHLHWVNAGYFSINQLNRIEKPIVWTLRDMWPLTGGCHYVGSCNKYKNGCDECPVLNGRKCDISFKGHVTKRNIYKDSELTFVAISQWLEKCAREALVAKGKPIKTILNGVNTDLFCPSNRTKARKTLGLNNPKYIVGFGAVNSTKDERKGYDLFLQAFLNVLMTHEIKGIVFGHVANNNFTQINNIQYFGHISTADQLKYIYNATDVMVVPSREEAFGKIAAEALACGTPVVAFKVGGLSDIIDHLDNGYLAQPHDTRDLAEGIRWALANSRELREKARTKATRDLSLQRCAKQYAELYADILK